MSEILSTLGSAMNSSHVRHLSRSTLRKKRKRQACRSIRGVSPEVRTGHFLVSTWGGKDGQARYAGTCRAEATQPPCSCILDARQRLGFPGPPGESIFQVGGASQLPEEC